MNLLEGTNLFHAEQYFDAGMRVLPLMARSETPLDNEWRDRPLTRDELRSTFTDAKINIGVVLGDASSGLIDVRICDLWLLDLLPPTDCVFRTSDSEEHRLYQVPRTKQTQQFAGSSLILEIRSEGYQIVPGSFNAEGMPIKFDGWEGSNIPIPAPSTYEAIFEAATDSAIGTILQNNYYLEERCPVICGAAGLLAKAGWSEERTMSLLEAVDDGAQWSPGDLFREARGIFESVSQGEPISGSDLTRFAEIVGEEPLAQMGRWLGLEISPTAWKPTPTDWSVVKRAGQ